MSWMSEAHDQWHHIHGKFASCPLDCGINEPDVHTCPGCGGDIIIYPSDPVAIRDCTDIPACDAVMAAEAAAWEAAEAARRAAIQSVPWDDPWAGNDPEPPF
jgi:hypothetical protein